MLYAFEDQQVTPHQVAAAATHSIAHLVPSQTVVQTISNPDGTVSLIQVSSASRLDSDLPCPETVLFPIRCNGDVNRANERQIYKRYV